MISIGDNPVLNVEVWKPIKDFPYEVSNLGNVRRIASKKYRPRGGELLAFSFQGNRTYLLAHLSKNNKQYTRLVHRLVAEAFIPNPDNLPVVNHKDRNRTNNRADNLEWCTQSYNIKYSYKHGAVCKGSCLGRKMPGSTSKYHYVLWDAARKKWMACTKYKKHNYYIGRFDNEVDAAKAADQFIKDKGWDKKPNFG